MNIKYTEVIKNVVCIGEEINETDYYLMDVMRNLMKKYSRNWLKSRIQ